MDAKSRLTGKDPDGKNWRQKEKGTTEDEMVGWNHWTWVWANSRRWWRTGKPGVMQFMGSQRVDTTEQLKNNCNIYTHTHTITPCVYESQGFLCIHVRNERQGIRPVPFCARLGTGVDPPFSAQLTSCRSVLKHGFLRKSSSRLISGWICFLVMTLTCPNAPQDWKPQEAREQVQGVHTVFPAPHIALALNIFTKSVRVRRWLVQKKGRRWWSRVQTCPAWGGHRIFY